MWSLLFLISIIIIMKSVGLPLPVVLLMPCCQSADTNCAVCALPRYSVGELRSGHVHPDPVCPSGAIAGRGRTDAGAAPSALGHTVRKGGGKERCFNTLRQRQNGRHFADEIFKCIFLNENVWISLKISLKFLFLRSQLTIFQHWFR